MTPSDGASPDLVARTRRGLQAIGIDRHWPHFQEWESLCRRFENDRTLLSDRMADTRPLIAFVGPKNAGKTTLLSRLITSSQGRGHLKEGVAAKDATDRLQWFGPESPPAGLHVGLYHRVADDDLLDLGVPYQLADVPGANEARGRRSDAAREALRLAHIKVLVVEARLREDAALMQYVGEADGACVLPVLNQCRPGDDSSDYPKFVERLAAHLPESDILPLITVPDLLALPEDGEKAALAEVESALKDALGTALRQSSTADLLQPQLAAGTSRFHEAVTAFLTDKLPATAAAAQDLCEAESKLGPQALQELLGAGGADRGVVAGIRQQLRGVCLDRTPFLCFPWRPVIGMLHLLAGALDKVPMLLVGSLPSLLSTTLAAAKNVVEKREFTRTTESGLRSHAEKLVRDALRPKADHLQAAITSDLGHAPPHAEERDLEITLSGMDELQDQSTSIFRDVMERHALSRVGALCWGVVGTLVFWSVFVWPTVALYSSYFAASKDVWEGLPDFARFPAHGLPVLFTALFLALIPMGLLAYLALATAGSRKRARQALADLQIEHENLVESLAKSGVLRINTRHPSLQACIEMFRDTRP